MKTFYNCIIILLNLVIVLQCFTLLRDDYSDITSSTTIFESVKSFIESNIFHQTTDDEFKFASLTSRVSRKRMEFVWKATGHIDKNYINYVYLLTDSGQINEVEVSGEIYNVNYFDNKSMRIEDFQTMARFKNIYNLNNLPFSFQIANLKYTFGKNAGDIYWFAPDGTYYEWNGSYFYSTEKLIEGNYGL